LAFGGREVVEKLTDASPGIYGGSFSGFAEKVLELCEDLFDRVQI
jgi:hypothetical protein